MSELARTSASGVKLLSVWFLMLGSRAALAASPRDWGVPLYLYASSTNNDTALLAFPPSSYAAVAAAASYSLVFEEPVAFGSESATSSPITDSVLITAFWSAERRDIQTTDWDLVTLNQHGGNYTTLGPVAYLSASPQGSWVSGGPSQAPLLLSYSTGRTDAITAPLNSADVNALAMFSKAGGSYSPAKQRLVGYAAVGTCPVCNTSLAAAYPSAGGADCPQACATGEASFTSIYPVGTYSGAGADTFRASMLLAGDKLKTFGATMSVESGAALHVSLNYLCCYTQVDKDTIRNVLKGIDWPAINVSFAAPVWRVDSKIDPDASEGKAHYSIIVQLDEASNARMEQWVARVEQQLSAQGISVHLPRSKQQPFHSTLGVVNGLEFAAEAALQAINEAVPPHTWTGNLTLGVPNF